MSDAGEVLAAAEARAAALANGDATALRALLHPRFGWVSHRGEVFDRAAYLAVNTGGRRHWQRQRLDGAEVIVTADAAVLRCRAVDEVDGETFRMPMTQVWVRGADGWRCLAGHAGPLIES